MSEEIKLNAFGIRYRLIHFFIRMICKLTNWKAGNSSWTILIHSKTDYVIYDENNFPTYYGYSQSKEEDL